MGDEQAEDRMQGETTTDHDPSAAYGCRTAGYEYDTVALSTWCAVRHA